MNFFFLHCLSASVVQKGPRPDDVAVIMYTSGSTGLAKGTPSPLCSFNLYAIQSGTPLSLRLTDANDVVHRHVVYVKYSNGISGWQSTGHLFRVSNRTSSHGNVLASSL